VHTHRNKISGKNTITQGNGTTKENIKYDKADHYNLIVKILVFIFPFCI